MYIHTYIYIYIYIVLEFQSANSRRGEGTVDRDTVTSKLLDGELSV